METNEINYEAVLKDLHLRKDAIEKAISAISVIISGGYGYSTRKIPKQELEDLYHGQGLSVDEIAFKTGKSASGVRVQLKKNGVEMRPRGTAGRAQKAEERQIGRQPPQGSSQGAVKSLKDMTPEERAKMQQLYGKQQG